MPEQAPPKGPKPVAPKAEGERIAKVLSRAGVASRREAERMIELGEVKVNGRVITSPALNVTAKDRILVNGKPLAEKEPVRLWLYYKPEGLVTSASDEKGRETVFDTLPEDMPRVMSIGRLDLNSEGLLLLTNDGGLKRRLELPSTGWLRKYRVRIHGNPTDPDLEPLRKGIVVEGERFQPMEVVLDRTQGSNAWLTVGLREGKNREIRRAMNAIGLTVNRLIRVSYGPFRLNELQPGEVEEIRPRVLRDQLGFDPASGEEMPAPRVATTSRSVSRNRSKTDEDAPARKPRETSARDLPGKTGAKPAVRPASPPGDKPRGAGAKPAAKPAPGTPGAALVRSAERYLDAQPKRSPARSGSPKPEGTVPRGSAGPARPSRGSGPKGPARPKR